MSPSTPLVVLGSRVKNGQPEALLRTRLDKAIELAQRYPDAPIVVSGRGEAQVMARYLRDKGVAPQRILIEPLATSTNENLERSHALLHAYLGEHYPEGEGLPRFRVVTNDFHRLRTHLWAWHLGLPVIVLTTPAPAGQRLRNYAREMIATPHSALRVAWRAFRARTRKRPDQQHDQKF